MSKEARPARNISYRMTFEDGAYAVEILDGAELIERVPGFLDKQTAALWIAAERRQAKNLELANSAKPQAKEL